LQLAGLHPDPQEAAFRDLLKPPDGVCCTRLAPLLFRLAADYLLNKSNISPRVAALGFFLLPGAEQHHIGVCFCGAE